MQRKGGFDVRENNIYYPERYDPTKTVAAQQNAPVTISAVTTPRGAQTTYRYFPFISELSNRQGHVRASLDWGKCRIRTTR
jgi:hypothetical protein